MAPTDREEHAERAGPPARLTVRTRPGPGNGPVVLAVAGELDHDTAAPLREALARTDASARVVVDCSGLRFCDSTGLNVLLRARLRLNESGGRLDLAGLRPPVDRMFEITGARSIFRVYGDAADALADTADPADGRSDA
ncbi:MULTISPECIES: STAS domain-containing protein [unclassified Streptomyces]|uniref:STAS domain-containing protein n=1 Tax=unclassified Streptomyces TaxID=2593676 RepID=UPI002E32C700|nr:STAS domain-containing protein [Streptomyces sp. NBC_01268]